MIFDHIWKAHLLALPHHSLAARSASKVVNFDHADLPKVGFREDPYGRLRLNYSRSSFATAHCRAADARTRRPHGASLRRLDPTQDFAIIERMVGTAHPRPQREER